MRRVIKISSRPFFFYYSFSWPLGKDERQRRRIHHHPLYGGTTRGIQSKRSRPGHYRISNRRLMCTVLYSHLTLRMYSAVDWVHQLQLEEEEEEAKDKRKIWSLKMEKETKRGRLFNSLLLKSSSSSLTCRQLLRTVRGTVYRSSLRAWSASKLIKKCFFYFK